MPDTEATPFDIVAFEKQLQGRWPLATRLDDAALSERFPQRESLRAGWSVPEAVAGFDEPLLVSVDSDFPWTLPRVALNGPVNGISFPHVEADGQICVAPPSAVFELPAGLPHVEALVADAAEVLSQGRAGANEDDFYTEAHSYWGIVEPAAGSFLLINEPPVGHSVWAASTCGPNVVLAESAKFIQEWSRAAEQLIKATGPALLIQLVAPLHPRDYPLTPSDLLNLATAAGAENELRTAVLKWKFDVALRVLISFPHRGKQVYLGAEIPTPFFGASTWRSRAGYARL